MAKFNTTHSNMVTNARKIMSELGDYDCIPASITPEERAILLKCAFELAQFAIHPVETSKRSELTKAEAKAVKSQLYHQDSRTITIRDREECWGDVMKAYQIYRPTTAQYNKARSK